MHCTSDHCHEALHLLILDALRNDGRNACARSPGGAAREEREAEAGFDWDGMDLIGLDLIGLDLIETDRAEQL